MVKGLFVGYKYGKMGGKIGGCKIIMKIWENQDEIRMELGWNQDGIVKTCRELSAWVTLLIRDQPENVNVPVPVGITGLQVFYRLYNNMV